MGFASMSSGVWLLREVLVLSRCLALIADQSVEVYPKIGAWKNFAMANLVQLRGEDEIDGDGTGGSMMWIPRQFSECFDARIRGI